MQSALERSPGNLADSPDAARPAPTAGASALARAFEACRPVLYPYLGSRLVLLAVGLLTHILIQPYAARSNPLHFTDQAALNIWGAWDSGWYVSLASGGYASHVGPEGWVNWVFFPAYPFLSAGLAKLLHLPVFGAMLVVSNLSFLAALFLARRLAAAEFGPRAGDLTVALLCVVPGSYIFSSAYTESLFLLAVTACLLLLRQERWMAAGVLAALAVLTRNIGLGLVLPFALIAAPRLWARLRALRPGGPAARRALALETARVAVGLALPVLALAAFAIFLYLKTGDPLAFVTGQKGWGRTVGNPLREPLIYLIAPKALVDNNNLVSIAFVWLSFALLGALALMRKWPLLILAAFFVFVPLSTGVFSYQRYCMVILPLFMTAAKLLADRPAAAVTTLGVLATFNGFMMVAWTLSLGITA